VPGPEREPVVEIPLADEPEAALLLDRLRDGRLAVGIRPSPRRGDRAELAVLDTPAALALASWLSTAVEDAWRPSVREHRDEQLRIAFELHGPGTASVEALAAALLREIPPGLLARALILLANAIGPDARARMVARLNATPSVSEDAELRRRLAEEGEAFGYAVAAAAVFDALASGAAEEVDD
jgi:hypothetical protein